jgi:hypothetical protein
MTHIYSVIVGKRETKRLPLRPMGWIILKKLLKEKDGEGLTGFV